ncbi:MAG: hypothetical protein IAI48_07395 [Candidatus Eremiobacteraeota bacterium]|nr:hypothetical protein [Candidatus Eremiobacteraeota bacterium]
MHLRRAAIAVFGLAVSLVVACGHQVTPNPTNNSLAGDIVVKFRVNGTLDFANYTYGIVIDTCGLGTPYPQALNTSLNSYSYAFFVGGSYGVALPQLVEYFVLPNSISAITSRNVMENSSLEQFTPNDNNLGNEFELIFKREELDNPLRVPNQLCPNIPLTTASATPVPTGSAGSAPTATAISTLAPGASPSPSPTATPYGQPTQSIQSNWAFNFFTIQPGNPPTILDSLGPNGANDTGYNSAIVNVNVSQDVPIFKATGGNQTTSIPAAQLSGGEIQNYP